jgi:hypothetical protein
MPEAVFTTSRQILGNDLSSGNFAALAATLADDGDTTPWTKVFQSFTIAHKNATTVLLTIEMAFLDDKSDAAVVDTQAETEPVADYQFTGYAWIRVTRTAATGTDPLVTINYRKD